MLVLLALSLGLFAYDRYNGELDNHQKKEARAGSTLEEVEEAIDFEELLNRIPIHKPEKHKWKPWSMNARKEAVG